MDIGAINGVSVLSVILGVIACFWGYRAFKSVLGVLGFFLGAYLAGGITASFTGGIGIVAIIAGIAGGIIVGLLFVTLYYIGIFILGASAGWLLGVMITSTAGHGMHIILFIILAVLGGMLAISFQRLVITISTALIGAWYMVAGTLFFFGSGFVPMIMFRNPGQVILYDRGPQIVILLSWIFLGISGMVFQYRYGARKRSTGK